MQQIRGIDSLTVDELRDYINHLERAFRYVERNTFDRDTSVYVAGILALRPFCNFVAGKEE